MMTDTLQRDQDQVEKNLVRLDEAALRLSIGKRTLQRLIDTGAIRVVRIRSAVRVPMSEIERIARGEAASAA